MNTDPQLLHRHGVLLPPSLAPVAGNTPKVAPQKPETWRERQRRFRFLAAWISGAMLLLVVMAALLTVRGGRASPPTTALARTLAPRAVAPSPTVPVSTAISVSTLARVEPVADAMRVATPSVSARPASQKIAPSERRAPSDHLGVSKPQSTSAVTGAFDAPFVPPAD